MKIPFVDLKAQYLSIKDEIDTAISDVLDNTAFIGGERVNNFARDFEKVYGAKHCVPCANGTDALYIAMKTLGIGPGDEVITTASSWISTSETITQTGARVVFVDIDEFHTIDPTKIEAAISSKTKAIIPVHLYGQMCDMDSIMAIAQKHNLKVIEDCAQSHFSSFNDALAGMRGDFGSFSFYPGKNLGAYGDAGCMITQDETLALNAKIFANHGAQIKHQHQMEGINSRLDGIQAAVLSVKLKYILDWTKGRERVAARYMELLKDVAQVELPKIRSNSRHTYHVFGIFVKDRDQLREFLSSKNVPAQIHYPSALPFMPAYAYLNHSTEDFPNAYRLQCEELSLPIFPEMTDEQIEFVANSIKEYYSA